MEPSSTATEAAKDGIDDNAIWKEIHEVIAMAFISIEAQVNAAIDMFVRSRIELLSALWF